MKRESYRNMTKLLPLKVYPFTIQFESRLAMRYHKSNRNIGKSFLGTHSGYECPFMYKLK